MNTDRPDLSRRRTVVVPSPDEGVDPIDLPKPTATPQGETATPVLEASKPARAKAKPSKNGASKAAEPTRDLNCEVTVTVMETIDFAKFKTKLSKREIVQQAILNHWSEYVPKEDPRD